MNEKRFIQLINLHIDGEISPSELTELEQELADNPRRQEIHQSYLRLQQGSQLAYRQFGETLTETVDLKKYQILAREAESRLHRGLVFSAGALVAACLSVVAAVAVFRDAEFDVAERRAISGSGFGTVEVLRPEVLHSGEKRVRSVQLRPVTFSSFESSRSLAPRFQPAMTPVAFEEAFRSPSPRVIRGQAAFDAPELISFEFQR